LTTIQKRKAFVTTFTSFLEKIEGAQQTEATGRFDPIETVLPSDIVDPQVFDAIIKGIESMHVHSKNKTGEELAKKVDEIINENSGKFLQCDLVFGLFCLYCCRYVSKDFYKELILFLGLYRQALNEKGWEKYNAVASPTHGQTHEADFCAVQTAEFAPDVANSFILDYFPRIAGSNGVLKQRDRLKFLGIDDKRLSNVILLIKHLCSWLFINKFSEGKVEMK
jgi:hypothetical protein